jgi:hypothetical protein
MSTFSANAISPGLPGMWIAARGLGLRMPGFGWNRGTFDINLQSAAGMEVEIPQITPLIIHVTQKQPSIPDRRARKQGVV